MADPQDLGEGASVLCDFLYAPKDISHRKTFLTSHMLFLIALMVT